MRCVIYARLSIERKESSDNVTTQIQECRAYIEDQCWQLVEVYSDSDISASRYSKKPRPGYARLLEAVRAGDVECIVITEMPRLYRRLEELLELMHLAETTALGRIETTDGNYYDLSTGMGMHNAVAAVNTAVLESRRTSDRMKRKRRAEAEAGKPHGGPLRPYGYQDDRVTINEPEATIIRECRDLVFDGVSTGGIVYQLNQRNIPTATGGRWYPRNLEQILTSRRIAGLRTHNGKEYPATWPSIISIEESDRLAVLVRRRDTLGKRTPKTYLLSRMVFCGLCGKPLISSGTVAKTGLQRKYRCRSKDNAGLPYGCGKIARTAEPVELLVSEAVLYRCDSPEVAASLRNADEPKIGELMHDLNAHKLKLGDLVDDYASGLLSREELARAKSIVEEALERTRAHLTKLESGRVLASIPADSTIREAWETADLTWRRSLISLLVEKVVILPSWPGGRRWQAPNGQVYAFEPDKVLIQWRV